jgi:hypothetical protein
MTSLAQDNFWTDKAQYDAAERDYYLSTSKVMILFNYWTEHPNISKKGMEYLWFDNFLALNSYAGTVLSILFLMERLKSNIFFNFRISRPLFPWFFYVVFRLFLWI